MPGRSIQSLDSAKNMSRANRGSEVMAFAVAMWCTVFAITWYSIYGLGHSEGAIGTELDNLKLSAVLLLPVVAVSSCGYWLSRFRRTTSRGPRFLVISSAIISGALVFAWAMVVPFMPSSLNIVALGAYCLVLGALSGVITSKRDVINDGAV